MARTIEYNHVRFDGGMTHNKRDTSDLTKLALISHLDIYRDNTEMHVMPGFVSDNGYGGSANGLKTYDIRAFERTGASNVIYALGTKSDGTGSKIFERDTTAGTEWVDPSISAFTVEGTADLINYPFFWFNGAADFNYPVVDGSTTKVAQHGATPAGNYDATWQSWLSSVAPFRTDVITGFTGVNYLTKGGVSNGISSITSSAVTLNAKTTSAIIYSIGSGDYLLGLAGRLNNPTRANVLLWDSASLLADQNVNLGKGIPVVIGYPSGYWATVKQTATLDIEVNGREQMTVQVLQGETNETLYKLNAVSELSLASDLFAVNEYYDNSMLWYGKIEVSTGTFIEGIWALGKGSITSQFGVSLLFDTSGLGLVEAVKVFGSSMYLAHNEDGSVSRLDDYSTGSYDVPATIETLIYGADSPFLKELDGVSITTENLPSGGSVQCYYRTDEDNSWVSMGTSNTAGKQRHHFSKAEGSVIGRFSEIQFKFVITGKTVVKNIHVQVTETDDLPY